MKKLHYDAFYEFCLFVLAHQLLLMLVHFMCGPRQFFFQCGPGKSKDWTPLLYMFVYFYFGGRVLLCNQGCSAVV